MTDIKTNVMRLLEQAGVAYTPHQYPHGKDAVDGPTVAGLIGRSPEQVFKTLVTRGHSGAFCVFVLPVCEELDLKKAARAAEEKSIELLHVSDLQRVTGYVRGGCSPLGMKRQYPTVMDETALLHSAIVVSAGKIGYQIETAPEALAALCGGSFADLTAQRDNAR